MSLDIDLAATTNYVTRVRRAIAQQRVQLVKLSDIGCSTADAEETLQVLRETLSTLEFHKQHLLDLRQRAALA